MMLKKDNKLSKDSGNAFKNKKYCIVDEIGMTPSYLLKHIHSIKKQFPNIIFICMGDLRQLPPVEEGRLKNFNPFSSPFLKSICNNNRIELTERHRYDAILGDYLDDGYDNGNWNGLKFEEQQVENLVLSRNICYFNSTRNRINKMCNEYLSKSKDSIRIGDDVKNMILYDGLRVIAIVSNKEYDFFNSEEYIVDCYNSEEVILSSVYNHNLLQLKFDEFLKSFDLNYIGTTHRSQGETYDCKVCLFDYNKLVSDKHIIYTACSRATKFDNVIIAEYKYIKVN
jgi:ATP-dependent exoDNAse (exonuclease V) alpha subunit